MNTYFLNLIIVYFLVFISPANAYLDPGSGSIILQAILGFIAASIATLSFYWNKVKLFLKKIFKKENKDKHSE
tara:strand:+ start:1599 stop:1817 length:219 start_codon:yes stop_codon:yes gene_type:complete